MHPRNRQSFASLGQLIAHAIEIQSPISSRPLCCAMSHTTTPTATDPPAMLHPDQSHIHRLVSQWWQQRQPFPQQVTARRIELFEAAIQEIRDSHFLLHRSYSPADDHRFVWANHWIDLGEGTIHTIPEDVHARASFVFNPAREPSRRELAAGN